MERLVADLEWFLSADDWHARVGVPHRRGYLFHGPPGTGKSSACVALAGHFGLDLASVSLNGGGLDDDKLARFFRRVPRRCALLLEDVDCLYREDRAGEAAAGKVTLSGLLNALDGAVACKDGRVVFMTTNHLEQVDPALRRPGRMDVGERLGHVDAIRATRMFTRFFPDALRRLAVCFGHTANGATPAEVQRWLVENRDDAETAAKMKL